MKNYKLSLLFGAFLMSLSSLGCVKGDKGDPGPMGAQSSGKIVATIYCNGTISGLVGNPSSLNDLGVEYNAVLTASGDVYATAAIIDEVEQTTGTSFYAAGEFGSNTAEVVITADYDFTADGGLWSISLNRDTLVTSITYTDASLGPDSPVVLSFLPSACDVNEF